jgi:DNA-binding MarR family transcriptional regulator
MSPRWLRENERDSIPWESRQDQRLENLLAALAVTLGELVQERMAATARCSPTAVAALQWVGRGRGLRTCDLAQALRITMPGASQLVASLIADGLVQRIRHPHDQRQWRLHLTELGAARTLEAVRARAGTVRELVGTLPFPWRLRLIRILERLLGGMVDSPQSVVRVCRHCDWSVCRHSAIEPCPVALAQAEWRRRAGVLERFSAPGPRPET